MARRPVSQKRIRSLRLRFRLFIDEAFDGNLSMASRELKVPFTTVQRYYQVGPRQISVKVTGRIQEFVRREDGVAWILGDGSEVQRPPWSATEAISLVDESRYSCPVMAEWRVNRVLEEIERRGASSEEALKLFFGVLTGPANAGVIDDANLVAGDFPRESQRETYGEELRAKSGRRAHLTHQLCEFWETLLELSYP